MEAQAQRAEFWTDLASAARAVVSQPSVPLVSVAVMLFPGVLVLTPLHHSVALSVIDFASAIFLLGWYGAERVFFLRHLEGKPVTLRHLLELVKPFMGRFIMLDAHPARSMTTGRTRAMGEITGVDSLSTSRRN